MLPAAIVSIGAHRLMVVVGGWRVDSAVDLLVAAAGGGLIGIGVAKLRFWVWRRRHPPLAREEYAQRMARDAHWN